MKKVLRSCGVLFGIPAGLFLFLAGAPSAVAQPSVIPTMTLTTEGVGSWNCNFNNDFRLGADGKSWELGSAKAYSWAGTEMTVQQLRFDPDPLVFNNTLVQNNTLVNQIYTLSVALPTVFGAPSSIRGSIATSLIGTAATVSSVAPFSIYSAQIDGVTVKTLQNNPFSLTTPNSAVSAVASYGFEANNVPVNTSIGILLRFQLTPGDSVTILSDFEVAPVIPEPSALALILLGGGAFVLRRFRR
jgi:hypothetical protein